MHKTFAWFRRFSSTHLKKYLLPKGEELKGMIISALKSLSVQNMQTNTLFTKLPVATQDLFLKYLKILFANSSLVSLCINILETNLDHPVFKPSFSERSLQLLQSIVRPPVAASTDSFDYLLINIEQDSDIITADTYYSLENYSERMLAIFGHPPKGVTSLWLNFFEHDTLYDNVVGQSLGFIVHDSLFQKFSTRDGARDWVIKLLRSRVEEKNFILQLLVEDFFCPKLITSNYQRVILYGLAQSCPCPEITDRINGLVTLTKKEQVFAHKHSGFGLHLVSEIFNTCEELREWIDSVELIDLSSGINSVSCKH